MWQLTWMLSFLPDWFWTLLFFVGLGAIGASWFIKLYQLPLKVGGVIAVAVSLWFMGAASNEEKWQVRVKELEAKLAVSEEQSKNKNIEVVEKVVTQTKVIREKAQKQIEYIDKVLVQKEEVVKFIEHCPIPKDILEEHNKAALNPLKETKP